MFKKFIFAVAIALLVGLLGCNKDSSKVSLLDDISGVWKAQRENVLMTIEYSDSKVRVLFDDTFIPVNIGEIDQRNRTVNFNVKLGNGNSAVWTIRQIWDNKDKTSFHLGITLHDGSQEEFSFVRKISTDDLNRIASLGPKPEAPTPSVTVTQAAAPVANPAVPPLPQSEPQRQSVAQSPPLPQSQSSAESAAKAPSEAVQTQPVAVETSKAAEATPITPTAFSPSFDCTKASTGPERLICSNPELSALDVKNMQAYKRVMERTTEKDVVRKTQIEWRKKERDACSDVDCIAKAYRARTEVLDGTK